MAFGPIPLMRLAGIGQTFDAISSIVSTVMPSGFCMSEHSFASSLFGAMPTEQVRPVASNTAAFRRTASVRASPSSSVRSAYTSSMPMSWITGLTVRTASLKRRE